LSADGGYTTRLDLEAKLPEDLVSDLFEEVKGDYTGALAYYRDKKTGKEVAVTAGDQTKPRRLRYLYANKNTAKRAVEREWKKMQEGQTPYASRSLFPSLPNLECSEGSLVQSETVRECLPEYVYLLEQTLRLRPQLQWLRDSLCLGFQRLSRRLPECFCLRRLSWQSQSGSCPSVCVQL